MTSNLSLFTSAREVIPATMIPFDMFLEDIKNGRWQDIVIPIRALQGEDQEKAKKKAPGVTLAGVFSPREDVSMESHSGFIGADVDDLDDPEAVKHMLSKDPYIQAIFVSIRGKGLCIIFRINPAKHREAYRGICEYLYERYQLIVDPTGINPSRLRFVSFDPYIYIADNVVEKFTIYPKDKAPKKVEKIAYVQSDFDEIINQVISGRINLCENYHEWVRIAFAIVHQFGENGRDYFHTISSMSGKYDPEICNRQYNNCLKHKGTSGNISTISTFYYYCKLAGIVTYSQRTKKIAHSAFNGKKGGLTAEQVVENLQKFEDITGEDVLHIVRQVQENNIQLAGESLIDQVEMYVRQNYSLTRNAITKYIENGNVPLKQADFNTIYIAGKKVFENLTYELIDRLLHSNFIREINPIHDFFDRHKDIKSTGHIETLFSTVHTTDPSYLLHFGRKWLVGAISAVYGEHSPLMLVLSGEKQGTGKTEFFRRMLPSDLQKYYGESKLDAGKDDEILMTQKWFLMDDEMGGKSKRESKRLKELTSKAVFSLREPYGRNNVDLVRLAVLCGTSNDDQLLNDPTGNRRIIPVPVTKIDHTIYNAVDKTSLLMEAWHLFKSGFEWKLNKEDIEWLKKDAAHFKEVCIEAELFSKYFQAFLGPGSPIELTLSEIKTEIEMDTKQKLNIYRLGAEMKAMGVEQKHKKSDGTTSRVYLVERTNKSLGYSTNSWKPPNLDHLNLDTNLLF